MSIEGISSYSGYISSNSNTSKESGTDLTVNDFFQLIAAQLQNQSMYDTVDNTQFISQLAQFTTLSQMNELTAAVNSNLAVSLLGKPVGVTTTDSLGQAQTTIGEVEQVTYSGGVPYLYVNGGFYTLNEITDVGLLRSDSEETAEEPVATQETAVEGS